jgi:hypothetical protein
MRKNGITHQKEGSLHMRKNGITHEKEGSLHMRKNDITHEKEWNYTEYKGRNTINTVL